MTRTTSHRSHDGSRLRRTAGALLLGAAVIAGGSAPASAAPGDAELAIPAPADAPAIGDRDFDPNASRGDRTGALGGDATRPDAPAGAPAAPSPTVVAAPIADPLGAAVVALLNDQAPATRLRVSAGDRAALLAFYAARQGAPVWFAGGRLSDKAEAARARIASAADDGLNPSRYRLPAAPSTDAPTVVARAEVEFSAGALAYAREAWGGRVAPDYVSPNIALRSDAFDAGAALASFDGSHDVAATLDGFNPQHPQFQALRKLLKESRGGQADVALHPTIPSGKLIQPGDEDPRVPALRTRLGLKGDADDFYYDSVLADAVVAFQKDAKVGASGLVNKQTIRALTGAAVARTAPASLIEVNMERWRWMPRDLGAKHVFVDLPAFKLHITEGGQTTYETRVIIGKPTNQTPLLSSAIYNIVVNPYWNVPVSIAIKELSQGSLRGFEVVDSRGRVVSEIDWEAVRAGRMRIRQAPGERNALGHIKFQFQNKFAVYLHDTSSRSLFARDYRAMSHGCVRVDQPFEFADALSGDQGIDGGKLKALIGGKERGLPLGSTVPVHLAYFTAWVGDGGKVETRPDLYGYDERVEKALKGETLTPIKIDNSLPAIARAKPKAPPAAAAQSAPPPQPQREGPGAWLARIFGDSRY